MLFTKVHVAAFEERFAAAQVTLPCDVLVAMRLAIELASTDLLNGTTFAYEVVFSSCLTHSKVTLAVD